MNIQGSDSCVVVVGTTGTGKTSTINIYTGSDLKVGEGAQSVTGRTIAVEDKHHADAAKWIDNPGLDILKRLMMILFNLLQAGLTQMVGLITWCSRSC